MPNRIITAIGPLRTAPSGGVRHPRVAVFCPAGLRADRPFLVVLFLHGYESLCACGHRRPFEAALRRHEIARQLADSRLNAIVVAPRLALSPREHRLGPPFATRRAADSLLNDAARIAAGLIGEGRGFAAAFACAPLLMAAFSGGHHALSALTGYAHLVDRSRAIAFFDALYDSDRYAEDPAGLLRRTALVCINRRHYDRDNGPKEENYRVRLSRAGVSPQRLGAIEAIRPGTAIMERVEWRDHCTMVAGTDALLGVLKKIEGIESCR